MISELKSYLQEPYCGSSIRKGLAGQEDTNEIEILHEDWIGTISFLIWPGSAGSCYF